MSDWSLPPPPAGVVAEIDRERGVLFVTLDRPPGNRLGWAQIDGLATLAQSLHQLTPADPVRAVCLRATGADFSQGADLKDVDMAQHMADGYEARMRLAVRGQTLIEAWDCAPVPTVVAASGRIIGGGACLVLASDMRVLVADACIELPEVQRGMHLSWGVLPILARELGHPLARALAMGIARTAAELPAQTAEIVKPQDLSTRGAAIATALAAQPPLAMRAVLAVLRDLQRGIPAAEAVAQDAERFAATVASRDFAEAMAAFFERRTPRYTGS